MNTGSGRNDNDGDPTEDPGSSKYFDENGVWEEPDNKLPAAKEERKVVETGKKYDPDPDREKVRGRLIYLLMGLVFLISAWLLILTSAHYPPESITAVLTGLFTPALTALGVGIGFYFGEKSGAKN